MTEPITVWITPSGPNPWKVVTVLEELDVPYKLKVIQFEETKVKPFIDVNPNGRVPAMEDPNHDVTIWESGAIILYLIQNYDSDRKLSYDSVKKKALLEQWLMFQMSGQGPYFGQLAWFANFHPEKVPSAIERYRDEMNRILGVLELSLKGRSWLVGDKMTYADLSFVWWNEVLRYAVQTPDKSPLEAFPSVWAWHQRMTARESFKKCNTLRTSLMEDANLVISKGLPEGVTIQDLLAKAAEKKAQQDAAASAP